jgi:hypothetical protein
MVQQVSGSATRVLVVVQLVPVVVQQFWYGTTGSGSGTTGFWVVVQLVPAVAQQVLVAVQQVLVAVQQFR